MARLQFLFRMRILREVKMSPRMEASHQNVDEGFAWIILIICVIAQCFEHVATAGIYYMAIIHRFHRGMSLLTHRFTLNIFKILHP